MAYITYLAKSKVAASPTNSLAGIRASVERLAPEYIKGQLITYDEKNPKVSQKLIEQMDILTEVLTELNEQYPEELKKDHFKVFQIPKATGGFRTIKAPDEDLKKEYSYVAHFLQFNLNMKAHNAAYAYVTNRCTKNAIQIHQKNQSNWFLKLDIKGFFDNCTPEMIVTQLNQIFPLNHAPDLVAELAKFATWENALPQGTPLSPFLTNLLMIPFDHTMTTLAKNWDFVYTRYADDILISKQETFRFKDITEQIETFFQDLKYPFVLKKEKTRYGNKSGQNWNLGLMLNKDNQITLGHDFKHQMKILLYKVSNLEVESNDPATIGLFSYLKQIEPQYYQGLDLFCIRKYRSSIDNLIKS